MGPYGSSTKAIAMQALVGADAAQPSCLAFLQRTCCPDEASMKAYTAGNAVCQQLQCASGRLRLVVCDDQPDYQLQGHWDWGARSRASGGLLYFSSTPDQPHAPPLLGETGGWCP
jgi:hypothetical protein